MFGNKSKEVKSRKPNISTESQIIYGYGDGF